MRTALSVSAASACCAETVSVRQSIKTSSRGIPYDRAVLTICSAMAKRSSAVGGIPAELSVRPTTAAPYFFMIGRMRSSTSGSPLTELTIGFPLHARTPASIALTSDESI